MLVCLVAIADGRVVQEELKALDHEIDLIKWLGIDQITSGQIGNWLIFKQNLTLIADPGNLNQLGPTIDTLCELIFDEDLKNMALAGAIKVAFSDNEFHDYEKKIITRIRCKWGL